MAILETAAGTVDDMATADEPSDGGTHPRVTVLLAVYNGGAYLREAVDSVLSQTYRDFELVIVDDGSTDGSIEALPADPRIHVLHNERNIGQIPSLNRGLEKAMGEYVARLDHDDICLPRRLERQVELLAALPEVALAATWVDIVETDGRLWARARPVIDSFAEFAAMIVSGQVSLVHPSLMFRRRIVVDLGGFDESLNASEDQDLYRKLLLAGHDARVVKEALLRYRRHENQMTVSKSAAVWESDGRSYDRFLDALSPSTPARTVRLMLRGHSGYWAEPPLSGEQIDLFFESAVTRLGLVDRGRIPLGTAIARRAAVTLLSGWAGDSGPAAFAAGAGALAGFVKRHGDARARLVAAVAPMLTATVPVGALLGATRAALTRALRSEAVNRLRHRARRSRTLRRLYARVADTRFPD